MYIYIYIMCEAPKPGASPTGVFKLNELIARAAQLNQKKS